MNFKAVYKDANNQITGNRDIIDGLFEKSKKRNLTPFVSMASMAAAAAVIALAVNMYPVSDTEKEIAPVKIAMEQQELPKARQIDPDYSPSEESDLSGETIPYEQPYVEPKISNTAEPETVPPVIPSEIAQEIPENTQQTEMYINYVDALPGSAVPRAAMMLSEPQITEEEYYEYMGIDIPKIAEGIEGWEKAGFDGSQVCFDEDGNIVSDRASVSYTSDLGQMLTVETTKLETLTPEGEYEKTDIEGFSSVVFSDGTDYKVYLKASDTEISVLSAGLSENEITDLINSITK